MAKAIAEQPLMDPSIPPASDTDVTSSDATARAVAQAVLTERRLVARELHDGPVQSLWYLGAELRALRDEASLAPADLEVRLKALQCVWADVYDELRQTMGDLYQPLPAEDALLEALKRSLASLERRAGIVAELRVDIDRRRYPLDHAAEVQLVRIVQAALGNIQRHASAGRVCVELCADDDGVTLTVEDDGSGFDAERVRGLECNHFGLAIMRDRAEALGGRLELATAPGAGTRLHVWIPAAAAVAAQRPVQHSAC